MAERLRARDLVGSVRRLSGRWQELWGLVSTEARLGGQARLKQLGVQAPMPSMSRVLGKACSNAARLENAVVAHSRVAPERLMWTRLHGILDASVRDALAHLLV